MLAIPAETSGRPSFFGNEYVYILGIEYLADLNPSSCSLARSTLVGPLLQHVQTIIRDATVTAEDQDMMRALVSKAIRLSAVAGSDLTLDRSIEMASLAVLEEALKKLPVQGFLDTVTEAMKSDSLPVSNTLLSLVGLHSIVSDTVVSTQITARGLQLVIERLPLIQATTRIAVSRSVVALIDQLSAFMIGDISELHLPSLQALERVSAARIEAEDAALSKTIRPLLSLAQGIAESNIEISLLALRLMSNLS